MGLLLDSARRPPGEIALDDLQGRRRTWAELDERVTRLARLLRGDLGLAPEDHVALLMGNRAEGVELVLAAILAGVWLTPINHHLTEGEVAYIAEDSGSRLLVTDPDYEPIARQAFGGQLLVAGDELERAIAAASSEPMPADGPPGATMIYTSGTTGRPKGVRRARAASVAEAFGGAKAAGTTLGLDGSGPHLVTGPLYHAAPLLFGIYDLIGGAPMTVMPHWDAERFLALVQACGARHTHLVPTMFVRLLRLPEAVREAFDPSPLRVVLHGAAPIAPHVKRAMIAWWGEVLVEYWGATESGVCTLVGAHDWLAHPGTVGRPIPSYTVFAGDEHGRALPAREVGTLWIRHTRLARPFEYHQAQEKTAETYLREVTPGLGGDAFAVGDIGSVDADGYVYLADRKTHTIISGGVNIFPTEIEQVLQGHPAVADVGVFGVPDEEWGESVKAAIELVDGQAPSAELASDILSFARARLAAYKVPRSIDFEARLPRYPNGKLHLQSLRERYWRETGRTI